MPNPVIPLDIPNARIPITLKGVLTQNMTRFFTDLVRRLGGERSDWVREARVQARENEAMIRALLRGLATGYYHTPATGLLSYTATSTTTATISVIEHTRSTAATTLQAGSIATPVTRGLVHYVYYSDVGNAGGAVTYLATTNVSGLTAAGVKVVGAIDVESPPPTGGTAL